jgi:putative ABC transport system permease protein
MPDTVVEQVAKSPGVTQADPFVMAFATTGGEKEVDVTIIGYRPGGLGPPVPVAGRQPSRPNEAMVDKSTGFKIGDKFSINGLDLTVVGQVNHMTLRGGVGDVYLNIRDAQSAMFKGNRIVTSIVTKGVPTNAAALDLKAVAPQDARKDMLRLFSKALNAIDLLNVLLWSVAIAVVGTTIYLSVLERVQDFAVMKAIGVSSNTLVASLAIQAMVVSLSAAALAVAASYAIAPLFPMPVYLAASDSVQLVAIAGLVGMLASLAALRRAVGVDPAKAFGA